MKARQGSTAAMIALFGAAVLLIALGGCGRKSPLDLPPSAAAPQSPTDRAAAVQESTNPLDVLNPFRQDDQPPPTPQPAQKKRIVLDRILD